MIDIPARIAFLKKIHLFYGMEDNELGAIAEAMEEVSAPVGGVVFEQDSKSENFYMIFRGSVRIARKADGKETQLAVLVKNDYFGEMGLIARRRRSGTVIATSDSTLLVIKRSDFEKLFRQSPQMRLNMDVAVQSRRLARSIQFKWLRSDEVVYFLARKHQIILYEKLILPLFTLVVPLGLFYGRLTIAPFFIVGFAAVLSFIAALGWIIWTVVDWGNDYYIVTNQRVVWLEKVVGLYDSRHEAPLSTILSVGVNTSQLGRILDYGNVIIRMYVGEVPFNHVTHPEQAQHMIEEYWNRTKEHAVGVEKEALKNAVRKRLGLPLQNAGRGFGEPLPAPAESETPPQMSAGWQALLKFLGANTLKLRYESGDNVVYRKHWVVLFLSAWIPALGLLGILLLSIGRLVQLAFDPNASLFIFEPGFRIDTLVVVHFFAFFPLALWMIYKVIDWSNDKFEVTNEQIIDIDREPFGSETRNAAQLDSILGTNYERRGILGNVFNYGTVYITVGGSKLAFEDVMDPATVQSDIDRRRMARQAKQNEAKLTGDRERMAEWLAFYHQSAEQFKEEERKFKKGGG